MSRPIIPITQVHTDDKSLADAVAAINPQRVHVYKGGGWPDGHNAIVAREVYVTFAGDVEHPAHQLEIERLSLDTSLENALPLFSAAVRERRIPFVEGAVVYDLSSQILSHLFQPDSLATSIAPEGAATITRYGDSFNAWRAAVTPYVSLQPPETGPELRQVNTSYGVFLGVESKAGVAHGATHFTVFLSYAYAQSGELPPLAVIAQGLHRLGSLRFRNVTPDLNWVHVTEKDAFPRRQNSWHEM
ncbi:MAG: hypothetical protein Q7S65_05425 [Nanoarchaeota archaeon]|nr:hypothetical protein [Nanoarchaeota archaeon]